MIEHFAGAFPFWLSPVQVVVLPVSENFADFAKKLTDALKEAGFRAETWEEESLNKRIRKAKLEKIPYYIVVGEKEQRSNAFTIESREDQKHKVSSKEEMIKFFKDKNK